MKLFISILFVIFQITIINGQEKTIKGNQVYQFIVGKNITQCTVEGQDLKKEENYSPVTQVDFGKQVRIDKVIKDTVVFTFLKWRGKKDPIKQLNLKYYQDSEGNRRYFKMNKKEFLESVEIVKPGISLEFGAATIPIKIRLGDGEDIPLDFYGNFNAGVGLSIKIKRFLKFYTGISLTSVPVDSITTKGVLTSPTNVSALTPSFGIIKEIDNIQIGGFIGWDFLSRKLGKNWIYQGRPWFGIGIGYDIFRVNTKSKKANGQG